MFSQMTAPFRALGLGPIAVEPSRQRVGIGSGLIGDGLSRANAAGWQGVFVLGDPSYYERFGFSAAKAKGFISPYSGPHLMALALGTDTLPTSNGTIKYAAPFSALD